MTLKNPLRSLEKYSESVVIAVDRSSAVRSTLVVWSTSPYTGIAEGEVRFPEGLRLRVLEELDFDAGLITGYSYEVYAGARAGPRRETVLVRRLSASQRSDACCYPSASQTRAA